MSENKGTKGREYLKAFKAAISRKTAMWSEVNTLKSEIDRKNSVIHLQFQDVEKLKTEAGNLAYSRWKEGHLQQEDFNTLFEELRKKEAEIEALEASKLTLESQLHYAKNPLEPSKPAQEDWPRTCPACGAGYRETARFCRKCGAALTEEAKPVVEEKLPVVQDVVAEAELIEESESVPEAVTESKTEKIKTEDQQNDIADGQTSDPEASGT